MIIDHEAEKSKNNRIIEVFIENDGVGVWIPAMATDLRTMNNNRDLVRIKEVRVRDLEND